MSKLLDTIKGLNPLEQIKSGAVDIVKDGLGKAAEIFTNVQQGKLDIKQGLQEIEKLKIEGEQKLQENKVELEKALLADVSDSRKNNTALQRSKQASWISKNLPYMLDMTVVAAFVTMLYVIMVKIVPEANKELFYTSFGVLGALVNQVFNYHRGTSRKSDDEFERLSKKSYKSKH